MRWLGCYEISYKLHSRGGDGGCPHSVLSWEVQSSVMCSLKRSAAGFGQLPNISQYDLLPRLTCLFHGHPCPKPPISNHPKPTLPAQRKRGRIHPHPLSLFKDNTYHECYSFILRPISRNANCCLPYQTFVLLQTMHHNEVSQHANPQRQAAH